MTLAIPGKNEETTNARKELVKFNCKGRIRPSYSQHENRSILGMCTMRYNEIELNELNIFKGKRMLFVVNVCLTAITMPI